MAVGRLALTLALAGCASDTDIVAQSLPSDDDAAANPGKSPNPSTEPGPSSDQELEPLDCADDARDLILIDKAGSLLRVRAGTLEVTALGTPKCLTGSVVAAAMDHTGQLLAVTPDRRAWWIDPTDAACTETKLGAEVSALSFVYAPGGVGEQLYVVDADELYVVEPSTLERRPLGTLPTKLLSGNQAGELLSFMAGNDPAVILSIRLADAQPIAKWPATVPVGSYFAAGAAWGDDLTLVFADQLYSLLRKTGEQTLLGSLPSPEGSIVCAASSVCGTSAK
jgi:hypothetical protein